MDGVTLGEIAAQLGGELIGDPALPIAHLGPLDEAGPDTLTFLSNPRLRKQLATSQAACVIVAPAMRDEAVLRGAALVAADPYLYFARLTQWWVRRSGAASSSGVHASAVVDATARVDASASIGPLAVVEADAVI